MTAKERAKIVLAFAKVLFVNGESTKQTVDVAARLSRALGLRAFILASWGVLTLQASDGNETFVAQVDAEPANIEMARVTYALRAVEDVEKGGLTPDAARAAIDRIARLPPLPTWLFALAAAAGSVALSVIFGIEHIDGMILIFLSAGAGAVVRRELAPNANPFLLPFSAALIAGIVGGLAVRLHLSSSLRLVAVCPCMVLVPGPHFLNGMIDIVRGRLPLGACRLLYALLIVVAISVGLLLGLACLGVSLPPDPPGRIAPLWQDTLAAGVAAAAYCIFFSTPLRQLPWPIGVGMLAHALRWVAITQFGFGVSGGALVAALAAGTVLAPVSRRSNLPFAAIGFASVVSLIPGVYLFRMASGLAEIASGARPALDVIGATIADGEIAATVICAIGAGLIVPKIIDDRLSRPQMPPPFFRRQ